MIFVFFVILKVIFFGAIPLTIKAVHQVLLHKKNKKMITFLHTSAVHIKKFEALVRKFNPDIPIQHFVNEELLAIAIAKGETDLKLFEKQLATIKEQQPSLVICTCSSLGTACDKEPGIHRIDEPIAAHIVQNYKRIGLAYTATSTLGTSENLLLNIAAKLGQEVTIVPIDCSSYWPYFEKGAMQAYEQGIAKTITQQAAQVEVILLAQASMEGAQQYLSHLGKEVWSSPAFGVEALIKKVK